MNSLALSILIVLLLVSSVIAGVIYHRVDKAAKNGNITEIKKFTPPSVIYTPVGDREVKEIEKELLDLDKNMNDLDSSEIESLDKELNLNDFNNL